MASVRMPPKNLEPGLESPSEYFAACTPNDSTDLGVNGLYPRAIRCGGAGNIVVTRLDDTDVTIESVTAGETLYIRPKKVKSTDTTATKITLFY